jgi:glycosyltransferase involved in cell wall biosynthesis
VTEPVVSVITPVHNGTRYLRETLESVLAQKDVAVQPIVVDDGSDDGSADLAREVSPEVVVVTQEKQGEVPARNHGVELAEGSHLAFIDADDLWPPEKLALQLTALEDDPDADIVFGHVKQFRSEDVPEKHEFRGDGEVRPGPIWGTLFLARATFQRIGPFRTTGTNTIGGFLDWLARTRDLGCSEVMLPQVLLYRRLHPWSLTATQPELTADYTRVLKEVLDRRRGR